MPHEWQCANYFTFKCANSMLAFVGYGIPNIQGLLQYIAFTFTQCTKRVASAEKRLCAPNCIIFIGKPIHIISPTENNVSGDSIRTKFNARHNPVTGRESPGKITNKEVLNEA